MGEATSSAVLTLEDIQAQLTEEERIELLQKNQPPKFTQGLASVDCKINEEFKFSVKVKDPTGSMKFAWLRDGLPIDEINDARYSVAVKNDTCILSISNVELIDQAEWQVISSNDFGRSTSTCYLKLQIPKHYKKPTFLECLRAVLTEEGQQKEKYNLFSRNIFFTLSLFSEDFFFFYYYMMMLYMLQQTARCVILWR